ncbi:MAG: hypothetical protein LCH67_00685 [Bacteroidetes bacterium]|nr:hypothetical protein [Bacteroidota bacterium]
MKKNLTTTDDLLVRYFFDSEEIIKLANEKYNPIILEINNYIDEIIDISNNGQNVFEAILFLGKTFNEEKVEKYLEDAQNELFNFYPAEFKIIEKWSKKRINLLEITKFFIEVKSFISIYFTKKMMEKLLDEEDNDFINFRKIPINRSNTAFLCKILDISFEELQSKLNGENNFEIFEKVTYWLEYHEFVYERFIFSYTFIIHFLAKTFENGRRGGFNLTFMKQINPHPEIFRSTKDYDLFNKLINSEYFKKNGCSDISFIYRKLKEDGMIICLKDTYFKEWFNDTFNANISMIKKIENMKTQDRMLKYKLLKNG